MFVPKFKRACIVQIRQLRNLMSDFYADCACVILYSVLLSDVSQFVANTKKRFVAILPPSLKTVLWYV